MSAADLRDFGQRLLIKPRSVKLQIGTADIDQQRTTPLSIFRSAADEISAFLLEKGVRPLDAGSPDPFGLHPARLADVGPRVHEAGMLWGAAKAAVHLQRRRDEGLLD